VANPEHLAILKQGVEVWNRWRADSEAKHPDLSNSDLSKSNFSGVDFRLTDLKEVDFRSAKLSYTDFDSADLTLANLKDTECMGSTFHGTDLSGVSFAGGFLIGTVFGNIHPRPGIDLGLYVNGPQLHGTDFAEVQMALCVFQHCDLSRARGLRTVNHSLPSSIDIGTLYRSKGKIPEVFLRGAGAPESLIVFQRSLVTKPLEFYSCFISHAAKDQEFAACIYTDLQANGVRCWFAPDDIQAGKKIHQQIDDAIRVYDRLLLVLSEHSMASEWVKTEIANARQREAREKRHMLFPISLVPFEKIKEWKAFDADTGKDSAREIREYFIPDFSNWKDHDSYQQAFQRLLKDLRAEGKDGR